MQSRHPHAPNTPRTRSLKLSRQPTESSLSFGDVLQITLFHGRNLAVRDDTGFSDPYCIFQLQGKTARSSVKEQTLNPSWNEMFLFPIDVCNHDQTLSLLCFDQDDAEVDDPLGSIEIDLNEIDRDDVRLNRHFLLRA